MADEGAAYGRADWGEGSARCSGAGQGGLGCTGGAGDGGKAGLCPVRGGRVGLADTHPERVSVEGARIFRLHGGALPGLEASLGARKSGRCGPRSSHKLILRAGRISPWRCIRNGCGKIPSDGRWGFFAGCARVRRSWRGGCGRWRGRSRPERLRCRRVAGGHGDDEVDQGEGLGGGGRGGVAVEDVLGAYSHRGLLALGKCEEHDRAGPVAQAALRDEDVVLNLGLEAARVVGHLCPTTGHRTEHRHRPARPSPAGTRRFSGAVPYRLDSMADIFIRSRSVSGIGVNPYFR